MKTDYQSTLNEKHLNQEILRFHCDSLPCFLLCGIKDFQKYTGVEQVSKDQQY